MYNWSSHCICIGVRGGRPAENPPRAGPIRVASVVPGRTETFLSVKVLYLVSDMSNGAYSAPAALANVVFAKCIENLSFTNTFTDYLLIVNVFFCFI